MRRPLSVSVDLEVQAGYVSYGPFGRGNAFRTVSVSEDVCVDYAANGDLLGIEVLALDEIALSAALEFARAHDLAFPRDLSGVLIAD